MLLGAHLSSPGGIHNSIDYAAQLEINSMQIFTKNPRQWFSSKLKEDEIDEYLENVKVYDIRIIFSHASHLLNLSAYDKVVLEKSQRSFLDEINRAEILNLAGVVFHPGSYSGKNQADGLKICSESLNFLVENTRRYNTKLIIEFMTGEGRELGYTFEQIRTIIDGTQVPSRIGYCLDTAHLFQAGYNIKSYRSYLKVISDMEKILGFDKLCAVHLNDSAKPMGSRVDKHANLGEGLIGRDFFYNIVHDKRFKNIPFILETPGDLAGYQKDIDFIRQIAEQRKFRI